jgi:prefoldin subunit 5
MTSKGGFEAEPTLADVLAAINAVAQTQAEHGDAIHAVRLDFAARGELDEARHVEVTQTLEALAEMAHTHQRELRELSIRFDRGAARTTARFDRVDAGLRQIRADVAELKADAALLESAVEEVRETVQRHLDDPHPHGNAA